MICGRFVPKPFAEKRNLCYKIRTSFFSLSTRSRLHEIKSHDPTNFAKMQLIGTAKAVVLALACMSEVHGFSGISRLPGMRTNSARLAGSGLRRVTCQAAPNDEPVAAMPSTLIEDSPKPIATGGTDYTTLPKKEITPLFLIPDTSVVGRGDMVGDLGFDPMGLATDIKVLKNYREAELKHGRLAMLAAVGWPIAEELQGPISKALGQPDLLVKGCAGGYGCAEALTRAPSVLNGGLDKISPFYWLLVIGLSAAIEWYGLQIAKKDNYLPGDLGFDPLNLYAGKDAAWKRDMQLKELNNGRLAMIAITGYAFNEASTKISVVKSLNLPQL